MLNGLSGTLLSHFFAERLLTIEFAGQLGESSAIAAFREFGRRMSPGSAQLGPASSRRAIRECTVTPLVDLLGFRELNETVVGPGNTRIALHVGLWTDSLDSLWRTAVRTGIAAGSDWCLCCNGRELRLVDARRTYSRAYLQFDVSRLLDDFQVFSVFWGILRAEAFVATRTTRALIAEVVRSSARHGEAVGQSLRVGVVDAIGTILAGLLEAKFRRRQPSGSDLQNGFDESLTVVYRILFLMFAESRGLVPDWHPIYRDHYTIESLRLAAERPGVSKGLWQALQAISRLAYRGCRAGTLNVAAFNGRLFSEARSPVAETANVHDRAIQSALLALSTSPASSSRTRRVRIDYRDLGVEQLGAVYEGLLDYRPEIVERPRRTVALVRGNDRRKTSSTFYTPQALTDFLVRRTLHPLSHHATSAGILQLRVVDPSMGSGAFLVAACRYLARAYERALIREGECHGGEISDADRAGFRRTIAQRCLFGVDLNDTAVQLSRLSLWLATLAADKPLTFLDHHLACGNSLVGASPIDVARRSPPATRSRNSRAHDTTTPLFAADDLEASLSEAVTERASIADTADDTADIVRQKERRLEQLRAATRWKEIANLWCACWMWPGGDARPGGAIFSSLQEQLATGRAELPHHISDPLLARSASIAAAHHFFHWPLEFPEIYFDLEGKPLENPGFDAVLGNPPWNMVRGDSADSAFFRDAGVYRLQGAGRLNRYQLFLERALALLKKGGRLGIVLPSGFATDHGSSILRRRLFDYTEVDTITGFDNSQAIFPIHRSVRFLLLTTTSGTPTAAIRCRFGIEDPKFLDSIPDEGDREIDPAYEINLTPSLLSRLTGEPCAIPDLRTPQDLAIIERVVQRCPRLGDDDGWSAEFGRELNATDDRSSFRDDARGMPILEGKHIEPFIPHVTSSTASIDRKVAAKLIDGARSFQRRRLAYRDVASSTNRVSLIAAILPAGVLTTHSLFCLKTILDEEEQDYLCGMMNSFVANYLVRQVMTTHLGSATIENLRVPKLERRSSMFEEIADLTRRLARGYQAANAARLQSLAAHAYGLTRAEFEHVLSTFPLVPPADRQAALNAFDNLSDASPA